MTLDLTRPAEPLERFGECLRIPRSSWAGEGLDEVVPPAEIQIRAGDLSECRERIVELVSAYGDGLKSGTGWSRIRGLSEDLELCPGLNEARVVSFSRQVAQDLGDPEGFPLYPLELVLKVNKRTLLERHLQNLPETVRPALFFYPASLTTLLQGTLPALEKWWDEADPRRLVLFVPAWEHFLAGPFLAVVGGDPHAGLKRLLGSATQGPAVPEKAG